MIYIKNVPGWERALRVFAGLAMMAGAYFAIKGSFMGYALAASGVLAILTGFLGFCPMCALAGRKLDSDS